MNAVDLLHSFQEMGARFELVGDGFNVLAPHGIVTLEMRELLKFHKAEIVGLLRESQVDDSELEWRIEALRPQLPRRGKPFPLLCVRSEINPKVGDCFSCGEKLKASETGYACAACKRAKQFLLYG